MPFVVSIDSFISSSSVIGDGKPIKDTNPDIGDGSPELLLKDDIAIGGTGGGFLAPAGGTGGGSPTPALSIVAVNSAANPLISFVIVSDA